MNAQIISAWKAMTITKVYDTIIDNIIYTPEKHQLCNI